MCIFVSHPMKMVTFLRKKRLPPKRVVDFLWERDTFRNKIMEIVEDFDEKSYNNNGKPWKSSRILRLNPNFFVFLLFLREDEVTWYCEQPTASPPKWARVYCGLRPGPTRVMPPSRQDEEGHQSASSYVHCLCWRTCCCTWMCVLVVLLLLIGLVCPHSSSPDS